MRERINNISMFICGMCNILMFIAFMLNYDIVWQISIIVAIISYVVLLATLGFGK